MLEQQVFPSDLSDEQWKYIKRFVPKEKSGGRPRKTQLRLVINAIFYANRTGCAWRYLPKEFPPWQTVYRYYRFFQSKNLWQTISIKTTQLARLKDHKNKMPKLVIIDAQSVRAHYGEERGYDGFKKVQGRKREILVDASGLILGCCVHRANQMENRGAVPIVEKFRSDLLKKPEVVLGDSGYDKPPFKTIVHMKWKIWPTISKAKIEVKASERVEDKGSKRKTVKFSNLKPKRWIVERSFAWMNNFRRLARDYERLAYLSEAQIYICGLQLALHRLVRDF